MRDKRETPLTNALAISLATAATIGLLALGFWSGM
jgi:hypothetical protein